MTKLEQLIKELCPNGVEYVPIGSLISKVVEKRKNNTAINQVFVVSNTLGLVKAEEYRENTVHSDDTSNYTIVKPNSFAYNPSRLNIGSIALNNTSLSGLVSPMYVVFSVNEEKMLPQYMDLLIKTQFIIGKINAFKEEGARFRFDFSRWNWIIIPLPPIEIQKEIINILRIFKEYNNLLTAELTARKKQYEFYRNCILTHDEKKYEYRMLKDICDISRGDPITQKSAIKGNIPVILGGQEPAYYCNRSNHTGEAVVISRSGAYAGFVSYWNEPIFVTDGFAYKGKKGLKTRYLYFVLKHMQDVLHSMKRGAGVPHVKGTELEKIKIPVPPLEEQERIVSILDRFDKLCNDITEGLPAEIEARRKQYEYYRDKLLSFKEV